MSGRNADAGSPAAAGAGMLRSTGGTAGPFPYQFILSIALHALVLLGAALSSLSRHPARFERPATFQLVRVQETSRPAGRQPRSTPQVIPERAEPAAAPRAAAPVPQTDPAAAAEAERRMRELTGLLDGLPAPVSKVALSSEFRYPWYIQNIVARVERNWKPLREQKDTYIIVSFSILADGSATGIRLSRSSGSTLLDNTALRAVQMAAPFGKLPPGFQGDRLDIDYTLRPVRQ